LARSRPKTPQDLTGHNCINLRLPAHGALYAWEFEKGGREIEMKARVDGRPVVGTAHSSQKRPLSDSGLAYLSEDTLKPSFRDLFRRYLEVGGVVRLKTALDVENVRSPVRTNRTGRKTGGAPISRGHLYWILSNPIYVGRLRHKGQTHDGLHPAIVDVEIWERVQQRFASQTQPRWPSQPDDHSVLVGKLHDDRGNRMGASHASKGGRRWRYYVSRAALSGRWKEAGSVVRIPVPEIENRVANAVGAHLAARANAVDGYHVDHGSGCGDYAITQHESAPMRRGRSIDCGAGDLLSEDLYRIRLRSATSGSVRF
jgi:hypothetical protein